MRPDAQSRVYQLLGLVIVSLLGFDDAKVMKGIEVIRFGPECLYIQSFGIGKPPLLMQRNCLPEELSD